MLSICKDKEYINCAILKEEDVPAPAEPEPVEEPVVEDTVFTPAVEEPKEPEKKTPPSEPKPQKPKRPSLLSRLTAGLTEVTGSLFDENIGSKDEEDNNNA